MIAIINSNSFVISKDRNKSLEIYIKRFSKFCIFTLELFSVIYLDHIKSSKANTSRAILKSESFTVFFIVEVTATGRRLLDILLLPEYKTNTLNY